MKKLFLGISAMFLFFAGPAPVWAQWPELDLDSHKQFRTNVADGFGGIWEFSYGLVSIGFTRPSSNEFYIPPLGDKPLYFNLKLKFDERSLPVEAGINLAFYGYLTELNKKRARLTVLLWVNPDTGEIDEVGFVIGLKKNNKVILSVPPRCFTLYEDILKKAVKFEPPHGIFDPENMKGYGKINPEDGIFYKFDIVFPAPAEGEPDFLALPAGN